MDPSINSAWFALGGALVGALASFAGTYLAQKSESKRALRRDLINAALTHWNRRLDHSESFTGEPVPPAQDFVIDFLYLEKLVSHGVVNASVPEIIAQLQRQQDLYSAIIDFRNKEHKKLRHAGQRGENKSQ